MPTAQVLHALRVRIAFHIFHKPPASRDFLKTYPIACQPPPLFNRRAIVFLSLPLLPYPAAPISAAYSLATSTKTFSADFSSTSNRIISA